MDKGFCTKGELNKQYQKYIHIIISTTHNYNTYPKICEDNLKVYRLLSTVKRNEYSLQKRTFSWLSITPSGASVVPDYIICMGERYIRVKERRVRVRGRSQGKKRGGVEREKGQKGRRKI